MFNAPVIARLFGLLEISAITMSIWALLRIDYYPILFIFLPIPVAVLGFFTMRLKYFAGRWNLFLAPGIVFTYAAGIMMLAETLFSQHTLTRVHFLGLYIVLLFCHIFFFSRANTKKLFQKH